MTLSLDGARERVYSQGHAVVECVTAIWTYKYANGYTVTLRGPLTAHLVMVSPHPPGHIIAGQTPGTAAPPYVLKFDDFQFDANYHDKYLSLESVGGIRRPEDSNAPAGGIGTPVQVPKTPKVKEATMPTMVNGIIGPGGGAPPEEEKRWDEPRVIIDRATIPGEPVNAFGIPQATMRCLEVRF